MEEVEMAFEDGDIVRATRAGRRNNGAPSVNGMPVDDSRACFAEHGEEAKRQMVEGRCEPQPVRRACIPSGVW